MALHLHQLESADPLRSGEFASLVILKPKSGEGGKGSKGSPDGEGEDDFSFTLSREEYLDVLFEELELPDLAKVRFKDAAVVKYHRAGHSPSGNPTNLNLIRTMRHSLARRICLGRPKPEDVAPLDAEIAERCRTIGEIDTAFAEHRIPYFIDRRRTAAVFGVGDLLPLELERRHQSTLPRTPSSQTGRAANTIARVAAPQQDTPRRTKCKW